MNQRYLFPTSNSETEKETILPPLSPATSEERVTDEKAALNQETKATVQAPKKKPFARFRSALLNCKSNVLATAYAPVLVRQTPSDSESVSKLDFDNWSTWHTEGYVVEHIHSHFETHSRRCKNEFLFIRQRAPYGPTEGFVRLEQVVDGGKGRIVKSLPVTD
jgi:hypothetical protein